MFYLAKCPLRISLIGGSTDLENFLDRYGKGAVISFPSTLYVYISIHDNNRGKYILNYSKNEEVETIKDIKNDVARIVLEYFNLEPVTISFLSDIISTGSGLASSTAYMIALVKAASLYKGEHLTDFETCKLALELERNFNPETGQQDSYGCGIGGLKKINFIKDKKPLFSFLEADFIRNNFDIGLYYTNKTRNSTKILKSMNPEQSLPLLEKVEGLERSIENKDINKFLRIFNEGWEIKKKTSSLIIGDVDFIKWDQAFLKEKNVLGLKICGAGGGGYFLALCKKGKMPKKINGSTAIPIQINDSGVIGRSF